MGEPSTAEGEATGAPPCPVLSALYGSTRAAVELVPGTPLSPLIVSCWPSKPAKELLQESWLPAAWDAAAAAAGAGPPPLFDAASQEYKELPQRMAKSLAMMKWNQLTISLKNLEHDITTIKDAAEREATLSRIEEVKAGLAEAEASLKEFKDTFDQDSTSLVAWMKMLFALADAGLTTLEVNGAFWPYCAIGKLFTNDNSSSPYDGAEKLLSKFKKRYELERGGNKVQVLTRLAPNIFHDGYQPTVSADMVARMAKNLFGDDAAETLDLVQVYWHDFKDVEVMPTLKVLQRLLRRPAGAVLDGEETESLAEGRKIKGIGLIDFPLGVLKAVVQNGVPITSVQIAYGIHDISQAETLEYCKEYNIKVFARDGLMGGLVNEKYIDAPCPNTFTPYPDLVSIHACLDIINHYGGWGKVQQLLKALKAIADKHEVGMGMVPLRWQMDQGTFPVATMHWPPAKGKPSAVRWHPKLFQRESFLTAGDVATLAALCNAKARQ